MLARTNVSGETCHCGSRRITGVASARPELHALRGELLRQPLPSPNQAYVCRSARGGRRRAVALQGDVLQLVRGWCGFTSYSNCLSTRAARSRVRRRRRPPSIAARARRPVGLRCARSAATSGLPEPVELAPRSDGKGRCGCGQRRGARAMQARPSRARAPLDGRCLRGAQSRLDGPPEERHGTGSAFHWVERDESTRGPGRHGDGTTSSEPPHVLGRAPARLERAARRQHHGLHGMSAAAVRRRHDDPDTAACATTSAMVRRCASTANAAIVARTPAPVYRGGHAGVILVTGASGNAGRRSFVRCSSAM